MTHKAIFQQSDPMAQTALILRIMEYLDENALHAFYVNLYANDEQVVVVLTDRNAALMLKLAIT